MKTLLLAFALLALPAASDAQSDPAASTATGTVYVFRSENDNGGYYALTYQTKTLARMKAGTYVVFNLPEGRQYLLADPSAKDIYGFDVKAGETQYIEIVTDGPLLRRDPTMIPSTQAEFESIHPTLKEISLKNEP
jgi:hypothetical protein